MQNLVDVMLLKNIDIGFAVSDSIDLKLGMAFIDGYFDRLRERFVDLFKL